MTCSWCRLGVLPGHVNLVFVTSSSNFHKKIINFLGVFTDAEKEIQRLNSLKQVNDL